MRKAINSMVNRKIYVGNISYQVKENDLQDVFSQYGTVNSVKIITDEYSGRSKGFGFVDMLADDAVDNAIRNLNGKEMAGKSLIVNRALTRAKI